MHHLLLRSVHQHQNTLPFQESFEMSEGFVWKIAKLFITYSKFKFSLKLDLWKPYFLIKVINVYPYLFLYCYFRIDFTMVNTKNIVIFHCTDWFSIYFLRQKMALCSISWKRYWQFFQILLASDLPCDLLFFRNSKVNFQFLNLFLSPLRVPFLYIYFFLSSLKEIVLIFIPKFYYIWRMFCLRETNWIF